jgi:hypothetical protein
MRPIYSFRTLNSHYRVERMSHTGALSLWKETPEGLWEAVMVDITESPWPRPWEGESAVFVGSVPGSTRPGYRITTSTVTECVLPEFHTVVLD